MPRRRRTLSEEDRKRREEERKRRSQIEAERDKQIKAENKQKDAFIKEYEELCYEHGCYLAYLYGAFVQIEDTNDSFKTINGHINGIRND